MLTNLIPPPAPAQATERELFIASTWAAAGRTSLPTELPDVPWCSLEGLAHTAGRTREVIEPAAIVERWRLIGQVVGPRPTTVGVWSGLAS